MLDRLIARFGAPPRPWPLRSVPLRPVPRREVRPPPLYAVSRWQALVAWFSEPALGGDTPAAAPVLPALPPARQLARVQRAFHEAIDPLQSRDGDELQMAVGRARTLHELWHLRARLYDLLAREFTQADAERGLAGLDRHFRLRHHRAARPTLTVR